MHYKTQKLYHCQRLYD